MSTPEPNPKLPQGLGDPSLPLAVLGLVLLAAVIAGLWLAVRGARRRRGDED